MDHFPLESTDVSPDPIGDPWQTCHSLEAEELEQQLVGLDGRLLQKSSAAAPSELTTAHFGSLRFHYLDRNISCLAQTVIPEGCCGLYIPIPRGEPSLYKNEPMPVGSCALYGAGAEHQSNSTGSGEWFGLVLSAERIHAAADQCAFDFPESLEGQELLFREPPVMGLMVGCLRGILDSLHTDPRILFRPSIVKAMEDSIIELWVGLMESLSPDSVKLISTPTMRHRHCTLKRCREYIFDSMAEPIYLQDLAAAAGASKRCVQQVFMEHFGLSPMAYLELLRMNRVRRQLRVGDMSVKEVAFLNGFFQLGRFAGNYRNCFGELPSQTLAAGR